jgi:hypothetical protein
MRFTLTYEGPLPPHRRGIAKEKMAIREQIHPQLTELWTHEPLSNVFPQLVGPGVAHIGTFGGHTFSAVVHDAHRLRAELDILMLHAAPPGQIIVGADVDNRLKTLFDALCWPHQPDQIPDGWTPTPSQQPLHCLLQDDRYITRVSIETDRWLGATPRLKDVRLFIRVRVWTAQPTNLALQVLSMG